MSKLLLALLISPLLAMGQVVPIDYSNADNWAANHFLDKRLPFDPTYTIVHPDTTLQTIVNVPYDTTSGIDIFYVYPTHPYSQAIGAARTNVYWNEPDSIDPLVRIQATQYGKFGRIFAPYYRQANLATFVWPTVTELEQANTLDTANVDVIAAFEYYMQNHNGGKPVILVGHSQGSIMLHQMIRKFEQDLATYQPWLDQICVAVLGGYAGPTVEFGSKAGGWTQDYPVCQEPDDLNCVMAWQCYRHTAEIETTLPYHHLYNAELVNMGYRYAAFDTTMHEVLLDSLGYSSTKPIPLMIFSSFHPGVGLNYSGVTTDFTAYENMYEAYYESSSTGAGLKLRRILTSGDDRKAPFPLFTANFHNWDHSCFSGDVLGLIEYKLSLRAGTAAPAEPAVELNAFPNPATEQLRFELSSQDKGFHTVTLRRLSGAFVLKSIPFSATTVLNTGNLEPGIYLYVLHTEKGRPIAGGKVVIE